MCAIIAKLRIQSPDKTLTESDLDQISQKIINIVKEKTGAIIRT
jgi:phenylalanyl-tRNA synthetase beta subunit